MQLKAQQLPEAVARKLAPLYVLSGDEPLQLGEAAGQVRNAARSAGYTGRETFVADAKFNWNNLSTAASSVSLFSDKTIIEITLPTNKLGNEGSKALLAYCNRLPENNLLMLQLPKLDRAQLKNKWLQAAAKVGVIVQVWPIDGNNLLQWLGQRARQAGLQVEAPALQVLAASTEGNLLAADQEIKKLFILHGGTAICKETLLSSVANSARFNVFKLSDCVLAGRIGRANRILNSLRGEGVAAPVVLWALTRDTRLLLQLKTALAAGQKQDQLFNEYRLWDSRKQLVAGALAKLKTQQLTAMLQLAAQADRQIKGAQVGDCWDTLLAYCVLFARRRP